MKPSRVEVRTVRCPRCLAEPGQACQGRRGDRQTNHQERVEHYATGMATLSVPPDERAVWLRQMPYVEYLSTPEWRERREGAIDRAAGRCQLCNDSERLHVHHRTYERRGFERPEDLTVLCEDCHRLFHDKRDLVRNREEHVSYGAFVHASIQQRRRAVLGGPDWQHGAERYASDNFPDYPEADVIFALRHYKWPDRAVTVSEINGFLKTMKVCGVAA